ncbi:hypothetical protein [Nocardia crassostreae]|uniref:hypothetical protein n=1 Tax=Nocardia crassostreae TaxID=53428 RepID=UPI0008345806|nr:hypothetical protein [Nocardia crassostreae]
MTEQDDTTAARPPMPALPPVILVKDDPAPAPKPTAAWAEWLDSDRPPVRGSDGSFRKAGPKPVDLLAEDPMAPLVLEARRRAAIERRRHQLRQRIMVAAAAVGVIALVIAGVLLTVTPEETQTPQAAGPTSEAVTPVAEQPAPGWCPEANNGDLVSGSGAGDLTTGPGVILRLEYSWYVLRDAKAVRSLLTPDALAAPEQATRDAISAIPMGTQHCVTVSKVATDRWNVRVDERRQDGSHSAWQQTMTTIARDGQVRISSILAGG